VGAEAACALYRAFLGDLGARFADVAWRVVWAVTPGDADLTPFTGAGHAQIAQWGRDLGERMRNCFEQLLQGAGRVVMIGADAPHTTPDTVAAAFAVLAAADAVFVPTRDGGYCLVGLRAPHDIFSGVPMGSAAVYDRTRERCEALGLRWRALASSFDVDDIDDVVDLRRLIETGTVALPNTLRVLREWQAAGIV
jgi:glycosyltransferase A (GT-A) superfamily protein (DUF2064 family)